MTRKPITKAIFLDSLDDKELLEGYLDGFQGDPEPGNNRSYSYWHGWRNGAVDGGYTQPDQAQMSLVSDVIKSGYFKNLFKEKTLGELVSGS